MRLDYKPFRDIIVAFRGHLISRDQMVAMWSLEQKKQMGAAG